VATSVDVLRHAVSEIGYREYPAGSNRTKFAAIAGHPNGQPWCATYVVAMFRRAGIKLPSESASTYYMRMGFRLRFRYTSTPQRGDVVFYNFSHVGILESFTATTVTCIEGNTSSGAGSQSNGGGVFRRTRSRSLVLGYGRPAYTAVPSTPPPAPTPPPGVVMVNAPLVSVLSHPRGGYVEVCADGGVFTFGGAPFYG
jgi:hypothetical protein